MRWKCKRIVAAVLAATSITTPGTAWANGPGDYCNSYAQVESNATGGDYVGGRLKYETMGSVRRDNESQTVTTTTSVTTSVGASGTSAGTTTTVSTSTTNSGGTVTTQEPIGFYQMNDGSVYEINCITGESKKVG